MSTIMYSSPLASRPWKLLGRSCGPADGPGMRMHPTCGNGIFLAQGFYKPAVELGLAAEELVKQEAISARYIDTSVPAAPHSREASTLAERSASAGSFACSGHS